MVKIRMLDCQVLEGSQDSYFRLLMDGLVRYVTIAGGTYDLEDMLSEERLVEKLPHLPFGNWNVAHIDNKPDVGPYVEYMNKDNLPSIRTLWHLDDYDVFPFRIGKKLGAHGVYEATSVKFPEPVVLKYAAHLWLTGSREFETSVYNQLNGKGVGPKFLGHLLEEKRPIGFILKKITDARKPGPEDVAVCQDALHELHKLGLKHGKVHRDHFLIKDGKAVLIDFSSAHGIEDRAELDVELAEVETALKPVEVVVLDSEM